MCARVHVPARTPTLGCLRLFGCLLVCHLGPGACRHSAFLCLRVICAYVTVPRCRHDGISRGGVAFTDVIHAANVFLFNIPLSNMNAIA